VIRLPKSSEFSTKNKITVHFEVDGRSVIVRQFPEPPQVKRGERGGKQLPLSHLSRPLCDLETDTPPVLCVATLGFNFDESENEGENRE